MPVCRAVERASISHKVMKIEPETRATVCGLPVFEARRVHSR